MLTKAREFTILKFDDSLRTAPEFGGDVGARGQHVQDHLHAVTAERNSDESDEYESVPSPHVEHDSIHFAFSNRERGTS